MLHEAALNEEVDPVDGVSPCILAGKVAALGSNTVTVMKDHVMEKKWKVDPPLKNPRVWICGCPCHSTLDLPTPWI